MDCDAWLSTEVWASQLLPEFLKGQRISAVASAALPQMADGFSRQVLTIPAKGFAFAAWRPEDHGQLIEKFAAVGKAFQHFGESVEREDCTLVYSVDASMALAGLGALCATFDGEAWCEDARKREKAEEGQPSLCGLLTHFTGSRAGNMRLFKNSPA